MEKITAEQQLRVAKYAMGIGKQNGHTFKTENEGFAILLAKTLTLMTEAKTIEQVEKQYEALTGAYGMKAPKVELWAFLCMFANWLSWAWHAEGNEELTKAWADLWYKLNDFSIETLKGDDLKKYLEITD